MSHPRRRSSDISRPRGMALVVVLWFLALMTVMVGAFAYSMRVETVTVGNGVIMARGRAMAEAGVYWTISELARPEIERQVRDDDTPFDWEFGGGVVRLSVLNESGLVDLNTGSRELLAKVFSSAAGGEAEVEPLLDAIQDFRDPDDLRLTSGAESAEYDAAGLPAPKNGPFESVEELQRVFGMTTELFRRVAPFLTVLNHSNGINPVVAPQGLLLLLADGDEGAVASWMAQREALAGTPGASGMAGTPPFGLPSYYAPARRNTYRIRADASFPDGTGRSRLEVTTFVYPLQRPPYVINAWREQVP